MTAAICLLYIERSSGLEQTSEIPKASELLGASLGTYVENQILFN